MKTSDAAPLVEGAPADDKPVMVSVEAPATLPEGYTFEAQNPYSNSTFEVTVPKGGVSMGETIQVPLPMESSTPSLDIPSIEWKDGICDCTAHGCCHPSFCCGIWFSLILLAQVLKRNSLTWYGSSTTNNGAKNTFKIVVAIFFAREILSQIIINADPGSGLSIFAVSIISIISIYVFITTWLARESIRTKYHIPVERCGCAEDCICAFCCGPCTVCQIARHTGNYEQYDAKCLSDRGLDPEAPYII